MWPCTQKLKCRGWYTNQRGDQIIHPRGGRLNSPRPRGKTKLSPSGGGGVRLDTPGQRGLTKISCRKESRPNFPARRGVEQIYKLSGIKGGRSIFSLHMNNLNYNSGFGHLCCCLSAGYRIKGIHSDGRQNSHICVWTKDAAIRHMLVTTHPHWVPQGF